ncbi:MAG: (Fe-S)-binding protein [Candidatus Lokiarchaeota archaeon]|nr:(Fe-S)-binding protein [Candidatus Lokiarchaeota archaeon]
MEFADISGLSQPSQEALKLVLDRCIKCNTCKYAYKEFTPTCPSGESFKFESYWASGRIRIARGLLTKRLEWTEDILHPIFACTTCGACKDSCQAPQKDRIVDIIEALREFAVKSVGAPARQARLDQLVVEHHNPYGNAHSDNADIRAKYHLKPTASVVYFIGCTSNYRQQRLRDATLSVLQKLGVDFTVVDERCCGSPLIRTGQLDLVPGLMRHNVGEIAKTGAKIVVTSCAGCYRTMKQDFAKYGVGIGVEVLHTTELINRELGKAGTKRLQQGGGAGATTVTYHDPCHLGHHIGLFEPPRDLLARIPGVELVEMPRNRTASWCCGAGGGVKIGYPDWALRVAGERVEEARRTGAGTLVSTCPFCKTNLSDANAQAGTGLDVVDLVELIDRAL